MQVQVGDRLLQLNGEELQELTSRDCKLNISTYAAFQMEIIFALISQLQYKHWGGGASVTTQTTGLGLLQPNIHIVCVVNI